jgi:tRNA nucleotidyltransferase (CCA-adding enzyme)
LFLAARQGEAARSAGPDTAASSLLNLMEAADAFRRPERLGVLLAACECADRGDGRQDEPYPPRVLLEKLVAAAVAVDAAAIARATAEQGGDIGAQVRAARLAAVRAALAH